MPPKKAERRIIEVRLKDPGSIPGNTARTIVATDIQTLSWDPLGVLVGRPEFDLLVPYTEICSIKCKSSSTQQKKSQTTNPVNNEAPARLGAGAARAGKTPRAAPSS